MTVGLEVRAHPGLHEAVVRELTAHLPEGGSVLDLGAGSGALAARLTSLGYAVTACDLDPPADVPPGVAFHRLDLDNPLPQTLGGPFDAVLAIEVVEHLGAPGRLLASLGPLVGERGIVLVSTPNVTSVLSRFLFLRTGRLHQFAEPDLAYGHVMPLAGWQVRLFLARGGVDVERVVEVGDVLGTYGSGSRSSRALVLVLRGLSPLMRDATGGWARLFLGHPAR